MRWLISHATTVDETCSKKQINVLIEDKTITQVSNEKIDIPVSCEYDLHGYTLMPGFINTHVHIMDCFDGFNEEKLKNWLRAGITQLRDQGIFSRYSACDAVEWREKCKKSHMYPGISVCGKFISSINGYGGVQPIGVTSQSQARDAVKAQLDDGVDHIKIALDEGYDTYTNSLELLSPDILEAICDESHKHAAKGSAHVNRNDKLEILIKAGIDEAAHACFDPIQQTTLDYMVNNQIAMTPTLSVYGEITSNWGVPFLYGAMENVKRFADLGGITGLGNDYMQEKAPWTPVGMPIMEIDLLRKAGLSMTQIINAATIGGAKILDNDKIGRIAPGYLADLIAVKGDPYEIPYLLSNISFVMKDGIVIKNN
jgi:imidazolonepropionase-like amidohydrolase